MSSIVVLIRNPSKEFQLQIIVVTWEKQYEIMTIGQFVDIVKYPMGTNKRINITNSTNENEVWISFLNKTFNSWYQNGFDIKYTIKGGNYIILVEVCLFF